MKIAYYNAYIGKAMMSRYCQGKKFALSGTFKSQGIVRALMAAGHGVTVFSYGLTVCNQNIPGFTEIEEYPEGKLKVCYPNIISKPRCSPINEWRTIRLMKKIHKKEKFDVVVYYNISPGVALSIGKLKDVFNILEYEDNIFNKALAGDKNKAEWLKTKMYNHVIKHTQGIMAVCNGLMLPEIKYRVLTPGIINDEVVKNVSSRANKLQDGKPVHVILTGGIHYSKGGDLLIKAMSYIKTPCMVSVYGNCELNETMRDLITKVPSCHKFNFNGYMEHDELIKTLDRDADILINTTRSMHVGEQAAGFPFKMMEYASTGRPIVSSEIGKLDEDYNSHITYYDGETPEAIGSAIEDVIANYDSKVKDALALQTRVLKEFTIEGVSRTLDTFIQTIERNELKK